jgi:starch phosphorylase
MAHLATVGSHVVNGVAGLHSELLKRDVLRDFYELWPEKFTNKTNGVTPRRWIVLANPRLADFITEAIGDGWVRNLHELRRLEPLIEDGDFRAQWRDIKRSNKAALATIICECTGVQVNPDAMFDVQVKRIHEYKRQHLNILHAVALYHRLKTEPNLEIQPRVFIFGGKAAPGYHLAKLMIRLITAVGDIINRDPGVRDLIKVVFLPNFNVTNGQRIYPAADLSEQISTAGKEASGTGNMKFQMNGALTIGTMDGANIEIREEVGADNFFLFGMSAEQVRARRAAGYCPMELYQSEPELREVIDLIRDGFFSRGNSGMFRDLIDNLLFHDPYMVLADYRSYAACQHSVDAAYRDPEGWTRMSILNTARSGKFSSDRTIREYCTDIWHAHAVPVELDVEEAFHIGVPI